MSNLTVVTTLLVLFLGVTYKSLHPLLFTTMGVGRHVQLISEFPYTCRKLEHPDLEACEDIHFDEVGRKVYLACSKSVSRKAWMPAVDRLDPNGRTQTDHFSVLDLDSNANSILSSLRVLKTPKFKGIQSLPILDLHGFDVQDLGNDNLRFLVVNHRPPVDTSGLFLDAAKLGSNSTVEVFEHKRGSSDLHHKQTITSEHIITPNRLTADGNGGFLLVNDKGAKTGFRRQLDLVLGGGTLAHCNSAGTCRMVSNDTLYFPNGLSRSPLDGHFYVPSSATGEIMAYAASTSEPPTFTRVHTIKTGYPIDNLHIDPKGDIYAATFPKLFELLAAFEDPLNAKAASTVTRVRKSGDQWVIEKVLEDKEGEVLPSATSVVHDGKTGRLILGGVLSPFVTVCDRK